MRYLVIVEDYSKSALINVLNEKLEEIESIISVKFNKESDLWEALVIFK